MHKFLNKWSHDDSLPFEIDPKEELVVVYFTQLIPAGDIDDHGKLRALIYQALVD